MLGAHGAMLGAPHGTVYRKTAKGMAEIETRVHRLAPRLRGALILVDGRKTDDELATLILAEPPGRWPACSPTASSRWWRRWPTAR